MIIRSRFKILSNLIRVVFVIMIMTVLPGFIQFVIDNIDSYFMIMLIPICLMLGWMVVKAFLSIKKVYNKIIITDKGLQITRFMGLGTSYFYHWNEITECRFNRETGGRGLIYYSFNVKKGEKNIVEFDSLTYRNFKKMGEAIEKYTRELKE